MVFSDTGASKFFEISIYDLFRRCCTLADFASGWDTDTIVKRLREAQTDRARVKIVETLLTSRLDRNIDDKLVTTAVELIKEYAGVIKITMLAEKLNISLSQLEKRFRRIVGATPKKFASIVRIKHIMALGRDYTSMTRIGLEAGYYDQAHFIKAFKSFTGVTPEKYFKGK